MGQTFFVGLRPFYLCKVLGAKKHETDDNVGSNCIIVKWFRWLLSLFM